jgi:hypothetical protein
MRRPILSAVLLAAVSTVALAEGISTRFGPLKIGGELDSVLSFKGHRVIRGGNRLSEAEKFRMGAADVVLVEETGGSGCPALYYFVRVGASGARATHVFGTCSEYTKITRKGDRILVTMPGFRGPFEPASDRKKAARETHVFTFRNGVITEKGRPVK